MIFLPETLDLDEAELALLQQEVAMAKPVKQLSFADLQLPCYLVEDESFELNGQRRAGVWYCYQTEANQRRSATQHVVRICSPLYIDAVTNSEDGRYFGRLLRYKDTFGNWRKWPMPMELLRGSGEEIRGELLAFGVEIEWKQRHRLMDYLQSFVPPKVVTSVTRTGWTAKGHSFVLPGSIIGAQDVFLQSDGISHINTIGCGGDFRQWQSLAACCIGNPILIVSVCVALAGPLLAKVHHDSGGIHWTGDSSSGKTTALQLAASVWGDQHFKRSWRATANGLESIAVALSDTCLCLDEINEADPQEVGSIVYCLGNGTGKTRANKLGAAKQVQHWRLSILSSGERPVNKVLEENGKQAKAGQLLRLLSIRANRQFGLFDDLHHFQDGREFSNYLKQQCARHYGHAGIKFVEYLISQGDEDFIETLSILEAQFTHTDPQSARVASRFAVYAMAGELASEAGILPWQSGVALQACQLIYRQWQTERGHGLTESQQILQNVRTYILKFGDTRFTDKNNPEEKPRGDRSGWYMDQGEERIYLFSGEELEIAGGKFGLTRILDALEEAHWIADRYSDKRYKKITIKGHGKLCLYCISPREEEAHA
ncbi:DUF927 domain-containing protein [Methylomicrobium agile]|uniref:DUF927 domain-containing protein n=1 Tax=Methylomicrobium agile TaxID=39774 RepID=UPI0006904B3D|nr:DUF927 domain-containing protein [Methylomicrobium agile]